MFWKDVVGNPNQEGQAGTGLRGMITSVPGLAERDAVYSARKDIIDNLRPLLSDKSGENFMKSVMGGDRTFYRDMLSELEKESGGLNTLANLNNMRIAEKSSHWLGGHPLVATAMATLAGGAGFHEAGSGAAAAASATTFAATSPQITSFIFRSLGRTQGATKLFVEKLGLNPGFTRMFLTDPVFQKATIAALKKKDASVNPGVTNDSATQSEGK